MWKIELSLGTLVLAQASILKAIIKIYNEIRENVNFLAVRVKFDQYAILF